MKTNSSALLIPVPAPRTATNLAVGTDIRDIKAPVEIPGGWVWLWWTLGALAVTTAVWLAVRYGLKRRARARAPEIAVPPDVRARNRLREALAFIHQPQPFCTRVSDTLRIYLEERFRFHAPDRTTEEFLDELQSSAMLSLEQKRSLGDFLVRCDLAKFARYVPGEPELRGLYDAAVRLVDETAPPSIPVAMDIQADDSVPPAIRSGRPSEMK